MKAILEFSYPDDEDKLRRAIHADQAFDGLQKVKSLINSWQIRTKIDYEGLLEAVDSLVNTIQKQTGETNAE
jgi:hypothetical protein